MKLKIDHNIIKISVCTIVMLVLMVFGGSSYMYNNGLSGKYANTKPKEGQIKVACIGDSITYGHGVSDWTKNNYPVVLQDILGEKYHVANFGSSGACVNPNGDQPYIKRDIYKEALEYDADIIVFMMGTNDAKPENWKDSDQFMQDYFKILASFCGDEKIPQIYVGLCAEAFYTKDADKDSGITSFDIQPAVVDKIVDTIEYQVHTSGYAMKIIDIHSLTETHPEWFEEDGIHPNKDGAKAIAQQVAEAISL